MSSFDYDLFVIGGGSGGVRAARVAAGYGARVAIAEQDRFGGTCVIRGCVPKKLLVYASRFSDEFEDAAGYGWTVGEPVFDWANLIANKDREIARLEGVYKSLLAASGVAVFPTRAVLADAHTISLADGRSVTADKILIATGSRPSIGDAIPGLEHLISSDEAFHLKTLPRRIVINGGGYIAAEFAGIFSGLGAEVTILYRGDKILRGFDDDLRDELTEAYQARGIRFVTERLMARIERTASGLEGHLDDGSVLVADQIMYATGRTPNTADLGLEKIGVNRGWNGHIVVDTSSRSTVANIFAVGDATDRVNLTPVAIRDGQAFADSEFGGKPTMVEHALIPTAVFSTPEIGTVGWPEMLAAERCTRLDVYKSRFRPLKATLSGREERMFMKLLVDADSGKVIGCHMLGADAAEIVQIAAIALRLGATKADFDATMALHPTAAEELVTMRQKWVTTAKAAE
jgi:glutathione reductase (NADPH)